MGNGEMPYAGIATFLKAPYNEAPARVDGEVAVLGIPFDEATTCRGGARFGPRGIRDVSTFWAYRSGAGAYVDVELGEGTAREILGGVRFVDAGDVVLAPTQPPDERHAAVVARLRPIIDAGLFPLVLGGDHSVTLPCLMAHYAARGEKPFQLVHFDTHTDYWAEEGGQPYTHASPMIRADELGLLNGITQYGLRGLYEPDMDFDVMRSRGATLFWCEQAKRMTPDELVAHLEPGADTYVTFDIDALDPAIAPATGTPEPGGFTYYEAKAILRAVCTRVNVIGMDMVEVAPVYDGPAQLTALHAARLILDGVGAVFQQRTRS
ncbi:MAG TPA: agmatinase [Thermoleophilia bacterium]|nr:agmatinase [Thermoleophilia bacterium]